MLFENSLFETYEDLKNNLAELLLLREDLISIRDDVSCDDKYKIKLLYKKNIEYLVEIQKNLEKEIMEIVRAKEILNRMRFDNTFINLTQIIDKMENEKDDSKLNYNCKKNISKNMDDLYFIRDLIGDEDKSKKNLDETFKNIAKQVSPNINKNITVTQKELWKKALKAKADNSVTKLKTILKDIDNNTNEKEHFNADFFSKDIANIKKNLNVLNKEIKEITKLCKENFDKEEIKKVENIISKIKAKEEDLIYSINILTYIREDLMYGFLLMLPGNQNKFLN